MKEINRTKKQTQNKSGSNTSNVFLNIIIGILGIVILFFAYNIGQKLLTKEKKPKQVKVINQKPSEVIQLEVLNGCGTKGVADRFTSYLRDNKFDVVQSGNFKTFDVENTLILDRTGNKANAQKVADALNIDYKNIVEQKNNDYLLDVSLVIGKDYNNLKPYK